MNKINPPTSDKSTARKIVQENISSLKIEEKINASQKICDQLRGIIQKEKPHTIITYHHLSDEVDISSIKTWFQNIGTVVTVSQDGSFESFDDDANIIALIPGRAFTKNGKRIGRGSGYYDEFIAHHPKIKTIGICFECQLFEDLPEDIWDKRMAQVVFG